MDGVKANLVVTDPPYNVSYESADGKTIQTDSMADGKFYQFLLAAFQNVASHMAEGGSAYIFHADTEIAYFITSLPKNAEMFGKAVRGHWGVESMHWSLDVVLNEDKRIVRKDNGARNLAVLKRMALNIIRADMKFEKASGPRKRFRASWDSQYLEEVLQNM